MTRLGQWLCALRGHDSVLHFEGSRVMLRCTSCAHDSPGWEIVGRGPRRTYDGNPAKLALAFPRLFVRLRRAA